MVNMESFSMRLFFINHLILILILCLRISPATESGKMLNLFTSNYPRTFKNESLVHQQQKPPKDVLKSIVLKFYKNGEKSVEKSVSRIEGNSLSNTGCTSDDKFAILIHGWIQSCNDEWVGRLTNRLTYYRGGCIICVDYSPIAKGSYMQLYVKFKPLVVTLVWIINKLINDGLDTSHAYMFGFSFGGQLALSIGRSLAPSQLFRNIDTCDMAGPGFDAIEYSDPRNAARQVQCFHTSRDKGTGIYECHRNIILGNCGYSQPAIVSQAHLGSHGLCFNVYINAFDYPFYALKVPPPECEFMAGGASDNLPEGFTIGYDENFNKETIGKIFVPTSLHYPYNLSKKELERYFCQI